MSDSPAVLLYDANGNPLAVSGGDAIGSTKGLVVLGSDGSNFRVLKTATDGALKVDPTGTTAQTVNQGEPNALLTKGWPVKLTDGTYVAGVDAQTHLFVAGKGAVGVAPTSNPVSISGIDGSGFKRIPLTDTQGRLIIAPAGTSSTSRGFADGQVVLSATAVAPVRKTTYTEPTSNAQRSIASSSANDTNTAGTGARQVKITYYTATMTGPFTETVNLNGTSAVNTVATNICFIEKLEVVSVGSGGSNAGTITLYSTTGGGGTVVWTIAIGDNKTFGAHHYVAAGQTCYITGQLVGIKGADTTSGFLRSKDPTVSTSTELQVSDLLRAPSSGQSFRSYGTPIIVVGPARVTAYAFPDSTSSRTYYGSFDYYEQAT